MTPLTSGTRKDMMAPSLGYTGPVVVFDLDDTLYPECEFAFSGYRTIAAEMLRRHPGAISEAEMLPHIMAGALEAGANPMDAMAAFAPGLAPDIGEAVEIYRTHTPRIAPGPGWMEVLAALASQGVAMGIITDGRSLTQRAKIKALGIAQYFNSADIMISEEQGADKTEPGMFCHFVSRFPNAAAFLYIGDNPAKDFRQPWRLGWKTVGLRGTHANIHPQTGGFQPGTWIDTPAQLLPIVAGAGLV